MLFACLYSTDRDHDLGIARARARLMDSTCYERDAHQLMSLTLKDFVKEQLLFLLWQYINAVAASCVGQIITLIAEWVFCSGKTTQTRLA